MNSKTKILLTISLGILSVVVFVLFGFQPMLKSVRVSNERLVQRQQELSKIEKQISEFKTAQTDLARATFKDDVYNTIVERENLSAVIVDLEIAAARTNTVESIQIFEEVESTRKTRETKLDVFDGLSLSEEVGYSMSVRNDFAGLVDYLQYLEHLPHFTEFDKITLNAMTETIASERGGGSRNTGAVIGTFEGVFLVKKSKKNDKEN